MLSTALPMCFRADVIAALSVRVRDAECMPLLAPFYGERLQQPSQSEIRRLPPIQNCFDDIRRQQGQPQDAAHIAAVDLLYGADLADRAIASIVEEALPPMRPSKCFHHGRI